MTFRTLLLFCIILLAGSNIFAQSQESALSQYNFEKDRTSKRSMYALGGWAVGNFAVSGALIGFSSGTERHFHEMNIYWNVVNLGLAGMGLLGAKKGHSEKTLFETIRGQHNTEKIYLLNAGLDVGYIFGGLYLTELAKRTPNQEERLMGFGQSIILQGGFLLILDTAMYMIYSGKRKKKLQPIIDNIDIGLTGFRMRF